MVSFQSKGSISSTCNVYHTNIYICSNETTNSKGHTHLAALSGRKERLLEAGHCCARISVQSKGSISSTCNVYHTNIYICSNETTNSKGHTHLAALSGRKERLLEAGHCCARISVVGSSF